MFDISKYLMFIMHSCTTYQYHISAFIFLKLCGIQNSFTYKTRLKTVIIPTSLRMWIGFTLYIMFYFHRIRSYLLLLRLHCHICPVYSFLGSTDKRTDVWFRDFIIWKINSGLWAVVWAGLDCEKKGLGRLWATL